MNKNGFISIYALMILSIFMLFTTLVAQRIYTYASVRKDVSEAAMKDMFILHEIKTKISQKKNETEEDTETPADNNIKENPQQWMSMYYSNEYRFEKIEHSIHVYFTQEQRLKHMEVTLNEDDTQIMNYAYVD